MQTVAGFPYFEVEFTKDGAVARAAEVTALHGFIGDNTATDLIAISHGWNNDMADARDLYARFLACMRRVLDDRVVPADTNRTFGVMAVLWPSITFAEQQLIPGGRLPVGAEVSVASVEQQLDRLEQALKTPEKSVPLDRARALIPELQRSRRAQAEFADLIRSALPATDVEPDDASNVFFSRSGEDVMQRLAGVDTPVGAAPAGQRAPAVTGRDAARGASPDVEEVLTGGLSAARNLLNYSTYYLMKERAGTVGRRGMNGVLRQLKAVEPTLRIHLVGHSFGARLVTAAADGPAGQVAVSFDTMTLLQAAFSHNAFASKFDGSRDGTFRPVVTGHKIRGPIVITCTLNDRAVGIAYPLASRLAGQDSSRIGDAADIFGGLGANGAQHTPEAVSGRLQPLSGHYALEAGKIYNLNADAVISDHSDICHDEVAFALLAVIGTVA